MTKFFKAILLAVVVLEYISMYSQIYASSQSNDHNATVVQFVRNHKHHLSQKQLQTNKSRRHHHHQHHRRHQHAEEYYSHLPEKTSFEYTQGKHANNAEARTGKHQQIHYSLHTEKDSAENIHLQGQHENNAKAITENNQKKYNNLRNKPHLWRHLNFGSSNEEPFGNPNVELFENNGTSYGNDEFIDNNGNEYDGSPTELAEENFLRDEKLNEYFNSNESERNNHHKHAHQAEASDDVSQNGGSVAIKCPKCENNHRKVEHISEEELTRLRIEFVKQQILEKLRLKDKPNVSAIGLPKPIYEGSTIQHEDEQAKSKDLDDYYARTSKKFIFLEREKHECHRLGPHPSICFSFKIDDVDVEGFDVNTAVLWIFKNKATTSTTNRESILKQQTIVVSEVEQGINSKYLPKVKPIAIQSIGLKDGWTKIDIEWPIKRWFGNHELSHLIHISCQDCEIDSMDSVISVDKDYRPFIMIDTQNRRRVSRQKRSINCTEGVTECCREKLYISFEEIGWGDWIIQPRGYDAYFCRGSCGSVASVTQSTSHHSTFLQKVSTHRKVTGKKPLELIPCCTAKQFSSLQLFFIDSNNTATLRTFPNMVIESCGCR